MAALHGRSFLGSIFPFLQWWPRVNGQTLRADLLAGLVGAIVVLPQGVAFATLAGMPPEYGLYCAMVPAVVAALWGSSFHAVSGPTNAVSLVVFATLAPLAVPGSAQYVSYALTLAFLAGALMLALGLLRLGALVNFISHTVVVGFTAGAGCLIVVSQLKNFFGVDVPRSASFLQTLQDLFAHLADAQPMVMLVGVLTLATGLVIRRIAPRFPYMIVAMLAGGVAGYILNAVFGQAATGIRALGALPASLPPLSLPRFAPDVIRSLFPIAIAVTVLSLTEAISIARAIAVKSGQRIDGNQEFIGQGLSNIVASFFSGYPSAASFNRSGVNFESGARTPLAAASSAVFLAIIVLGVAQLAAHLPLATMAAILLIVGAGLIDVAAMRQIARTSRSETAVLAVTFGATLLMHLEFAILLGVAMSLLLYLNRTSQPPLISVVPDPLSASRKTTEVEPGFAECPQLKILRIGGSIYFGAIDHVAAGLDALREAHPEQRHLLLYAKSVNFVDVAGAELLAQEAAKRRAGGGGLYFYSLRQSAQEVLEKGGYLKKIGGENVFLSKREAIGTVFARLDREICACCRARIFLECRKLTP